jgi:hypothetical protein
MAISAIDRAMGMVNGQNSLDQGGSQDVGQQQGKMEPELIKKLLDMLAGAGAGGSQGGGGSSGSGGSGGQPDMEQLNKMMGARQGMQAMMPDSDNGRKIGG